MNILGKTGSALGKSLLISLIDWDEKHHNSKRQKERDNVKEKFLKENFNCIMIRINEKEFLKNIETSINNISGLIKMKYVDNH